MKCNFTSTYIPIPNDTFTSVLTPHTEYKLKRYKLGETVDSIRNEFESLYSQKYTHVTNMPGNFNEIILTAKHFNIICLDARMQKYISDYCSRRINPPPL